uniref:CWF21 domain-containing protein n=1 Tax=Acrobeloides nanus TaxID=290746 RepID=A0A914DVX0_9BILA
MYNGIGLQTARGSGTNGYVQANLSNLLFSKNKVQYNTEADIAKAEAEVNRKPNVELLDHEYKRRIEIRCAEFEDLMEDKGFSPEEITAKVDEYRKLLLSEYEAGKMDLDHELDTRNTHSRAKVAKDGRDRFRKAFGIDEKFVDGSSLEKIKKRGEVTVEPPKEKEDELDAEKIKHLMEKIKKEKSRKRKESSSSSSSSSSDSDSDSDSSSSGSSGASSSTELSSSSMSSDSDSDKKRRKEKSKKVSKKKVSKKKSDSKKKRDSKKKVSSKKKTKKPKLEIKQEEP